MKTVYIISNGEQYLNQQGYFTFLYSQTKLFETDIDAEWYIKQHLPKSDYTIKEVNLALGKELIEV